MLKEQVTGTMMNLKVGDRVVLLGVISENGI
jgi:hypothetical protein